MILSLSVAPTFARTFNAFGPEKYVRDTGPPVTVTKTFSVFNPSFDYFIRVGNANVASAVISINGVEVVSPNDFNPNILVIEKPVTLRTSNEIAVQVRSKPGSSITVEIIGIVPPPAITGFNPKSGPVGTLVSITGSTFISETGAGPQVTLNKQGGGTIAAPVASFTFTSINLVIPSGAASGPLTVTVAGQSGTSASALTIVPSSSFTLKVAPGSADLIQGQSITYAVTLTSTNGFSQLAALSVSGLPAGVAATFKPTQITAGQTAILKLTAPANQATSIATLTVSATATVDGIPESQSATLALNVKPVTTTFLGRTVVQDPTETPLAGVTITMLGVDGSGHPTGCTGSAKSDAAGNFMIPNPPPACVGAQLIRYDGTTATSPPGVFAGVDLIYTFVAGQVTTPPFVIHLPRIDNAETVMVKQNAPTDQIFTFRTIPGLSVTIYAGTFFTLVNGTRPDPFPFIAIQVPVDRLPDEMPMNSSSVGAFIVAFQPANSTASQPVAVTFPNTLNTPPGTANIELDTLDPTKGVMVKYGTATVSNDGTQIIPDMDPAHPGHRFGLVHFDWHGPMAPPAPGPNPGGGDCKPGFGGGPDCGDPVNLPSGLLIVRETDITIFGRRGSISIVRVYRTLSGNPGPFGIGTGHNYSYQLNTFNFLVGQGPITLIMPDGNQFPFNLQPNGTLINSTMPFLRGAVIANPFSGVYNLRWKDGTTFQFQAPSTGPFVAYLNSITDTNGNVITLVRGNANSPIQITQIVDPVGRKLALNYDSFDRITSIVDPIGRTVSYIYNSQGTLAAVIDPAGGVTTYTYDSQNRLIQITDARGVVVAQNTYDANGRVVQQVQADGGIFKFAYTLLNPMVPASPVLVTTETDPLGNQTTYHFDPQGFLLDATDVSGQMRAFTRSPGTNLLLSVTGRASCSGCGASSAGDESFTYDGNGNMLTRTDALGNTTSSAYDSTFNRLVSITDPLGNTVRLTYDSRGNLLTRTDSKGNTTTFAYDSSGLISQVTDPAGQTTTFVYDAFGNLVKTVDLLGNSISSAYDVVSRPIEIVDALGRKSTTSYDALDRPVTQTDALGNVTQFNYDPVGNLLSLTDARGNKTSFTYDLMGRLLTKTDSRGQTDTRAYDSNGNRIRLVDRRGQTSIFTYDALNRLTGETYQDGSIVTRSYDTSGRLTQVVDSVGGSFNFSYDFAGRLTSSASQFGTLQHSYDGAGRVVSRQVVGQPSLQYSYDGAGNLLAASLPQASANFTYDGRNQLISLSRSNGVSSQYGYDTLGRLLTLTDSNGATVLVSQNYSYDAVGNRSASGTNIAQPLITQGVTNTYDAGNRLLQSGSTSYSYDGNGNLTSKIDPTGTTTYAWDSRNRLQFISAPNGQKTTFLYDFRDNLISQMDSGPTLNLMQNFVLDDLTNVAYVGKSNGDNLSILAGRGMDQHLAAVHFNGQVEYGLTDALNSTIATVDQNGAIKTKFFYEPFGQSTSTGGSYPFQFTGRTPVSGGLYYYRARYYDPAIGRFISEDPSDLGALGEDTNLYVYVENSPTNYVDPYGLYTVLPRVPAPSPVIEALLKCIECETGIQLVVTSTSEDIPQHPPGTPHRRGVAVDLRYPSDPDKVLCAAAACGAGFGLDEKKHPSPQASGPHIHLQIPPGKKGGHGDLPKACS